MSGLSAFFEQARTGFSRTFWIANVMYLAFVLSAVLSTIVKVIGYRWGLPA